MVSGVVMVLNAFGIVASSRRDCHNTGRELLTGVRRASQLSRVGERGSFPTKPFTFPMIVVSVRKSLNEGYDLRVCCERWIAL